MEALSAAAGECEGRRGGPRSRVGRRSDVIWMAQVDADDGEAGPAVQQPEEIGDDKGRGKGAHEGGAFAHP